MNHFHDSSCAAFGRPGLSKSRQCLATCTARNSCRNTTVPNSDLSSTDFRSMGLSSKDCLNCESGSCSCGCTVGCRILTYGYYCSDCSQNSRVPGCHGKHHVKSTDAASCAADCPIPDCGLIMTGLTIDAAVTESSVITLFRCVRRSCVAGKCSTYLVAVRTIVVVRSDDGLIRDSDCHRQQDPDELLHCFSPNEYRWNSCHSAGCRSTSARHHLSDAHAVPFKDEPIINAFVVRESPCGDLRCRLSDITWRVLDYAGLTSRTFMTWTVEFGPSYRLLSVSPWRLPDADLRQYQRARMDRSLIGSATD